MKTKKLFFVTCLMLDDNPKYILRSHAMGFFETFKRAERAVLKNEGDIFERGYYNHAVIEEYGPGLYYYSAADKSRWFSAKYRKNGDQSHPKVAKINKPKKLEKIVNFAM